jgi:hypothetical protein
MGKSIEGRLVHKNIQPPINDAQELRAMTGI